MVVRSVIHAAFGRGNEGKPIPNIIIVVLSLPRFSCGLPSPALVPTIVPQHNHADANYL